MLAIQSSAAFLNGEIFAIPLTHISSTATFFLSFTRSAIKAHAEGDGDAAYALGQVMGHLQEGTTRLLGTLVKSSTSIIVKLDLDSVLVEEVLTQDQTFAHHMFHRAGMLVYKTSDASLVRHTTTRNPWQLSGGGGGGGGGTPPHYFPRKRRGR